MRWLAPFLALLPLPLWANPVTPGAVEFAYGSFCSMEPTSEVVAEDTIAGTISNYSERPEFIWSGTTVPAVLGLSFGVHVKVALPLEGPVRFHVAHPPMGPEGTTEQSWIGSLSADDLLYIGFSFDHDYERVTGPWTLSARSGDILIYEITFDVVDPKNLVAITMACGGEALLS